MVRSQELNLSDRAVLTGPSQEGVSWHRAETMRFVSDAIELAVPIDCHRRWRFGGSGPGVAPGAGSGLPLRALRQQQGPPDAYSGGP